MQILARGSVMFTFRVLKIKVQLLVLPTVYSPSLVMQTEEAQVLARQRVNLRAIIRSKAINQMHEIRVLLVKSDRIFLQNYFIALIVSSSISNSNCSISDRQ